MRSLLFAVVLVLGRAQTQSNTGVIEGRVLNAATLEPVTNVQVTLVAPAPNNPAANLPADAAARLADQIASLIESGARAGVGQAAIDNAIANAERNAGVALTTAKDIHREVARYQVGDSAALSRQTTAGELNQPVLVFKSVTDHVVSPASLKVLTSALPAAQIEVRDLADSYHVATLDNDADAIFAGSLEFVHLHSQVGRESASGTGRESTGGD